MFTWICTTEKQISEYFWIFRLFAMENDHADTQEMLEKEMNRI